MAIPRCFCGTRLTFRGEHLEVQQMRTVFTFACGYCGRVYESYVTFLEAQARVVPDLAWATGLVEVKKE